MTGSHSKKFIFFHLYKVAGCSLVNAIAPFADFRSEHPHTKPFEVLADPEGKKLFEEYYTFAFVRNPWDWQVSLYEFMRGDDSHFQHATIIKQTFDEYIEWRINEDLKTQYEFLSDKGDTTSPISLDFLGRLENINNDFTKLCLTLGINGELPHFNKSTRNKDYRSYYSSKSRDIIGEAFKVDVETFNYEF